MIPNVLILTHHNPKISIIPEGIVSSVSRVFKNIPDLKVNLEICDPNSPEKSSIETTHEIVRKFIEDVKTKGDIPIVLIEGNLATEHKGFKESHLVLFRAYRSVLFVVFHDSPDEFKDFDKRLEKEKIRNVAEISKAVTPKLLIEAFNKGNEIEKDEIRRMEEARAITQNERIEKLKIMATEQARAITQNERIEKIRRLGKDLI